MDEKTARILQTKLDELRDAIQHQCFLFSAATRVLDEIDPTIAQQITKLNNTTEDSLVLKVDKIKNLLKMCEVEA